MDATNKHELALHVVVTIAVICIIVIIAIIAVRESSKPNEDDEQF